MKKKVNLYMDVELIERAKKHPINLSGISENAIREWVEFIEQTGVNKK